MCNHLKRYVCLPYDEELAVITPLKNKIGMTRERSNLANAHPVAVYWYLRLLPTVTFKCMTHAVFLQNSC